MKKYIAIDVGGTYIKYGILTENMEILYQSKTKTLVPNKEVVDIIIEICEKLLQKCEISGIGVATAGIVDSENGIILKANENIPNYRGTRIKARLVEKFNLKTYVENDVKAIALGELFLRKKQNQSDSFFVIALGTGIGGALVLKGNLIVGKNYAAGEIGYIDSHNGESYEKGGSTIALVNEANRRFGRQDLSGEKIFEEIKNGQIEYVNLVDEWLKKIASGMTAICYILDIGDILIGGGISAQSEYLEPRLNKILDETLAPNFKKTCKVSFLTHKNDTGMMGAIYPFIK